MKCPENGSVKVTSPALLDEREDTEGVWGDPSIANDFSDQRYVFMANLTVPTSKMPTEGINGGMDDKTLGGACIARSQDGGLTFGNVQCLSNNSGFYDGSSIVAAGTSVDHRVFAAFRAFGPFNH